MHYACKRRALFGQRRPHLRGQQPGQLDIVFVPRAIGDDMAAHIATQQREIAEDVEDLVPRRLIGETQPIVDRSLPAEDEQIVDGGA